MGSDGIFTSFRIVSYVVLLAMLGTFLYAVYITLKYWAGIGV